MSLIKFSAVLAVSLFCVAVALGTDALGNTGSASSLDANQALPPDTLSSNLLSLISPSYIALGYGWSSVLAGAALLIILISATRLGYLFSLSGSPSFGTLPCPVTKDQQDADVIVVGAGVVGSAVAVSLSKQGKRVMLLERDWSEPDRIVGELMQPGGLLALAKLGMSKCVEGIDSPQTCGYAVFNRDQTVLLDYPEIHHWDSDKNCPEKEKKRCIGRGFHHGKFIMKLREAVREQASSSDTLMLKEGTVISLVEKGTDVEQKSVVGVKYREEGEMKEAYAPLVIACDGVNSKFRRELVEAKPKADSSFVGVILSNCELPYPDRGHVLLVTPSPVLAYPISSTEVRMLVDVPYPLPSASNGDLTTYLLEKVTPQLPEQIRTSFVNAIASQPIRSMPCSRLHPEHNQKPGLLLLGDSWNMRHPLTGGGMTVGLSDVVLVSELFSKMNDFQDQGLVQNELRKFYKLRLQHSCSVNVLAQALYGVFSEHDPMMKYMRDACFAYFNMGDSATAGPIGLLSCTKPSPSILVYHFIAVALVCIYQNLKPYPTPSKLLKTAKIGYSAVSLLCPLLYQEHVSGNFLWSR